MHQHRQDHGANHSANAETAFPTSGRRTVSYEVSFVVWQTHQNVKFALMHDTALTGLRYQKRYEKEVPE